MLTNTYEELLKFFINEKYWISEDFRQLLELIVIIFAIGTLWYLIFKPILYLLQKWNGTRKR